MRRNLIVIGSLVLLVCLILSGCNQEPNTVPSEEERFIGTWWNTTQSYNQTMSLFSNGSCVFWNYAGTWEIKNGQLVIDLPSVPVSSTYDYEFSNNDNTLTLTFTENNYVEVWTRR